MELNPLAQIDPLVIALTVVIFVATYWTLRRVFFDRTIAVMEQRQQRCVAAAKACAAADALIAQAQTAADELLATAHQEAEQTVATAREQAEEEHAAALAAAKERAEIRLKEGRAEILAARDKEVAALKREATTCIGLACDKLAGNANNEVIEATVERLVTKTLQ